MNAIQGIQGASSLWDNTQSSASSSAANQLSETIAQLKTGGGPNASSGDEETVTLQRMQPDGSIIVITMKGDEVVSETKIRSPQSINEPLMAEGPLANQPAGAHAALLDRFNDTSSSITAGALFAQGV